MNENSKRSEILRLEAEISTLSLQKDSLTIRIGSGEDSVYLRGQRTSIQDKINVKKNEVESLKN